MTIFSIYQINLTNYIFDSTVCPMGHPSVSYWWYAPLSTWALL